MRDPFTKVVDVIAASGLDTPRHADEHHYAPFALVLDDGRRCRARIGGTWDILVQHPDLMALYGCGTSATDYTVAWGSPHEPGEGDGITRTRDGWTVMTGTAQESLIRHRIVRVYYVGVAGDHDAFSDSEDAGTRLVTKCGRAPELKPESVRTESGELVVRMKIVAHCPGGDVMDSPNTRVTITSDGANIASGTFDLSDSPIVVMPSGPSGNDSTGTIHDFHFPLGTFWRIPVSTTSAPTDGVVSDETVDLDVKTLVVDCDQDGSLRSSVPVSDGSSSSTANGPAAPASGSDESASIEALRALANADRPYVTRQLTERWVPQLSSKRPGMVADGIIWNNAQTLQEHLKLRLDYPEVRLLWTGDWSTFSAPNFWVTIAGTTFSDAQSALSWCLDHSLDRDHCYAKLVSTSHPVDGSTAFNP